MVLVCNYEHILKEVVWDLVDSVQTKNGMGYGSTLRNTLSLLVVPSGC